MGKERFAFASMLVYDGRVRWWYGIDFKVSNHRDGAWLPGNGLDPRVTDPTVLARSEMQLFLENWSGVR